MDFIWDFLVIQYFRTRELS